MASIDNYQEIFDVLQNYDTLNYAMKANGQKETSYKFKDSSNKPAMHILYKKRGTGTMQVVEALSDTKKGVLHIVRAYKRKSEKD